MTMWDTLWIDGHLATMRDGDEPYGAVRDGALAVEGSRIAWVGPRAELEGEPRARAREVRSLEGRWMTPGLVDCHTHLVFGGNRADEFEARLGGASYAEIARGGGGILSTVRATRAASEDDLVRTARGRLERLMAEGVTTVEIKSGYGLEMDGERAMLQAARRLGREEPVDVHTTFLGAHAVPPEFEGRPEAYVDHLAEEMLPSLAEEGLVDAVDAFLESIAFGPSEVERVFGVARGLGLPLRLHADQLEDGGGAALAARWGARSADHLEHASEAGVQAMADADTAAVLLPGAFYFLRETSCPPVEAFRRHGVPMAVATDANPGSSPALSPLLMMNMACTLMGLTPEEALAGMTRVAAGVLGLGGEVGTLEVGKEADLAVWDVGAPGELAYWMGAAPLHEAVKGGTVRT